MGGKCVKRQCSNIRWINVESQVKNGRSGNALSKSLSRFIARKRFWRWESAQLWLKKVSLCVQVRAVCQQFLRARNPSLHRLLRLVTHLPHCPLYNVHFSRQIPFGTRLEHAVHQSGHLSRAGVCVGGADRATFSPAGFDLLRGQRGDLTLLHSLLVHVVHRDRVWYHKECLIPGTPVVFRHHLQPFHSVQQ